jgi:TetR/AcrR family transcriptional regulator, cholesterol catabolism regulator
MQKIRTYSPDEKLVAERREQIVRAAVQLIAKKGFGSTGIRQIAEACNMTIGNLYHYIGKKEDIIFLADEFGLSLNDAFVVQTCDDLEAYSPQDALTRAVFRYIRHIDNTREFTNMVYKELRSFNSSSRRAVLESELAIIAAFENILKKGNREGVFDVRDTKLVAGSIVSLAEMWAVKQWQFKGQYSLDQYMKVINEGIIKQVALAQEPEKAGARKK